MENPSKILNELQQFTGTEDWYKNPLFPKFLYTDGVKYLATEAEAYWLIDYIFSNQVDPIINKEEFQVWKISVLDNEAIISVENGNDKLIKRFFLEFTDFPLTEFTFWFTDRTLLLPSEY